MGVAQIVITAATPMMEEPEQPFPPPDEQEQVVNHQNDVIEEEDEDDLEDEEDDRIVMSKYTPGEATHKEDSPTEPIIEEPDETPRETVSSRDLDVEVEEVEDTPQDSGQLAISSSTGSDGKLFTKFLIVIKCCQISFATNLHKNSFHY